MKQRITKENNHTLLLAILTLAWPTILEQVLQTAVSYVDTAMVSRLGAAATAAVGVTTTINWLINSSVSALGIGFLAFIAKEVGAKNDERARQAVSQVVLATLVSGALFTVAALMLSERIPVWMQAEEGIRAEASRYFFILYMPMLPRAALILFGTALRAAGDTKTPMRISVGMNILNILLNDLLIYPAHEWRLLGLRIALPGAGWGVAGAAAASAIAFTVGGIGITIALWRHQIGRAHV